MLLALDIGSSNTAVGLFEQVGPTFHGRPRRTWRIRTEARRTADDWALLLETLLQRSGCGPADLHGIAVANVVPAAGAELRAACASHLGRPADFVGETLQADFPLCYDPPESLGADRLANAAAALDRYGGPAIVFDLGTALTVDALSAQGELLGGAIAPGLGISMAALYEAAPHLPRIEIGRPEQVIGSSTVEGLRAGAYYGFLGQVEGLARRFRRALGRGAPVVATGGLAPLVAQGSGIIDHLEPHLTLEGLRVLWQKRRSNR